MMTALYAVVGHPISHSKSPHIHSLFAAQTGEDLEYTAIQAPLDDFAGTVRGFFKRGGSGLNVTVPFKQEAWALADRLSDRAQRAEAVNTLYLDEQEQLMGENTDGPGLVRDLTVNHGLELSAARILILGAGGAVRGVLAPLLETAPAEVVIANRTVSRAEALCTQFADAGRLQASSFEGLEGAFDLIINGTSASLQGQLPPLADSLVKADTVAYDMMYGRGTTVFNQWAQDHNAARTIDGLGMLVEQAAESFHIWRGVRPDTTEVIRCLREEGL
ncbi:shikimate dehydrogenase [Marinobacteraceae bacterium S3BR75-40.1]